MKTFKIEFTYITYVEADGLIDAIDEAVNKIQNLHYGEIVKNMNFSKIGGNEVPEE